MNPSTLTVRHTPLGKSRFAEGAATCDKIVAAAAQCAPVQSDPLAKQAIANLQTRVAALHVSLANRELAAQALMTAIKATRIGFAEVSEALVSYEKAVATVADGDGSIINQAGLLTRPVKPAPAPLGTVVNVTSKRGKQPAQGIVKWPKAAGATSYAVEVNFTPATPTGPWTVLSTGTKRSRVVTAPSAGAQFLARVAAVASDGTQGPWSDAILVTAA
jgi:hypothetical protein